MSLKPETITGSFHGLILTAIALNHIHRDNLPARTIENLPPVHYAIEYATVKCDIGRRTGKSRFIICNSDVKTLVVVRKMIHKDEYSGSDSTVLTIGEVLNGKVEGLNQFELIYFDEPLFLFRNEREVFRAYGSLVSSSIKQTFIHLGV